MVSNYHSDNPVHAIVLQASISVTLSFLIDEPRLIASFSVEFQYVKFSVVTQYPNALEGMNAFLLPLEDTVWVGVLVSCVVISIVAQLGKHCTGLLATIKAFGLDALNVTVILLGQVNSDSMKIFNKRAYGIPITLVWIFFGGNVIMDNLYNGSIFSYLSATKPPIVPRRLADLIDSNIPIITLSSFKHYNSALKALTAIYVDRWKTANLSTQLFIQLDSKLVFINVYVSYVKFMKTVLTLGVPTSTVDRSQTYAILDISSEFNVYTDLVKTHGSRLVIDALEDTPFVLVTVDVGYRNCLHGLFARKLDQLKASGIEFKWAKLERMISVAYVSRWIGYPDNLTGYHLENTGSISSLSKEDPVSIKMVESIFILCSILQVVSFISFAIEFRHKLIPVLKCIVLKIVDWYKCELFSI
ncbi:hypothetical protein Fcan01_17236 [Folsomia candida]|uniref:Uncharacterized protein n=1 Tax=Folsomia candida TaxID=158441 RepID=A0A226DRX4_FOLCA|nr:hypothetical protein Fcan01_17236 [Folsomia candida]